jgi:phosphoribosylformylglycinamidine synthase subunit PurQ / glutaminase
MAQPRILVLRAPGANCDRETAFAFSRAGGLADLVHVNRLLERPALLRDYQVFCVPGGFTYGDDIASGRILGNQIEHHLAAELHDFKHAGKLILGICNGFQVLIKCGLLLDDDARQGPPATLDWNASGKFEDRWVYLRPTGDRSVFLRGITSMYLPVAHGEGRFVARSADVLNTLDRNGHLVLRYSNGANGGTSNGADSAVPYPANPNGSSANVAGVCDTTGRVFGLMPHPERHIDRTHHPRWTRGEGRDPGDGLHVFQNAVTYFA